MMMDDAKLQEFLYTNAMRGNWRDVVKKYDTDPRAQSLVITKLKDTVLHLAVFDNQEDIVSEMVEILRSSKSLKKLGKQNQRKNTPLHIAASLGNLRMCKDIASVYPSLLNMRNGDGETPLFLAALYGHKQVFFCLLSFSTSSSSSSADQVHINCRRNDGDSVLNCAIRNEQFDLAFQIIEHYPELVYYVDEQGLTPLHLLARKPSVFKSGCYTEGWKKIIIYYCTAVNDLKPGSAPCCQRWLKTNSRTRKLPSYPPNYAKCFNFFRLLWKGILVVTALKTRSSNGNKKKQQIINEDLEKNEGDMEVADGDGHYFCKTNRFDDENGGDHRDNNVMFPENYITCVNFFQILCKAFFICIFGYESDEIRKIKEKKEKNVWSVQVMNKILELLSPYQYVDDGSAPLTKRLLSDNETQPYIFNDDGVSLNQDNVKLKDPKFSSESDESQLKETAMLIAVKNGVVEMVEKIYELYPLAIYDTNKEKKNVALLAAENRRPQVYEFLLKKKSLIESVFRAVDHKGNTALHLAANFKADDPQKPWSIPGDALQMLCEHKWYRYVKNTMPCNLVSRHNDGNKGRTPKHIFHEDHKTLVEEGGKWLTSTSESCSVVASLIATVAFACSATIPGGNSSDEKGGGAVALLHDRPAFVIFSMFSLLAVFFSVISLVAFLAILTSRKDEKDFKSGLPWKMLVGMSALFLSIVAMLVTFCAGHFFQLSRGLEYVAIPLYVVICLPVALTIAMGQLPLYFDLLWILINDVPKRSSNAIIFD